MYFPSKIQFSYHFSDSRNDKLYDKYFNEKFLDFQFRCVEKPLTKNEFLNREIYIKNTLHSKKIKIKLWYDALSKCTSNVEMQNYCGLDRRIIGQALKERSKIDWIKMIDKIISKLPD